ncbi:MAG TPA: zinc-binding dehydrogenase [Candidatus Tumulicola sp.]|nr:zinc-binding dehydrogenase [Candidatus Tumulicola sp.]
MTSSTVSMHAVIMHERGGADVLRYEEMPLPVPAPGEALIRVRAATVNHPDLFHRSGRFLIHKELPHVLGMDVAGEIAGLGEGVAGWREGDRVVAAFEALGRERDGAYAEFTTVPARELHRIPDGLSYAAAASIGLAFTTAWIALCYNTALSGRDRVVVHAASSGVGTSALQIARWKRAHALAISAPGKEVQLRALGAETVIDHNAPDLVDQVKDAFGKQGATCVLELVGRATLQQSIEMLSPRGRIIVVGTLSGDVAQINAMDLITKNASIIGSMGIIRPADFDRILALFADGTFRPVIDSVMPLREAGAAHERIESGAAFGKIVLEP